MMLNIFNIWVNEKPFGRSDSFALFPEEQLAKEAMAINVSKIIDVSLPDGRTGRAIMSYFHPQVANRLKDSIFDYEHRVFFTIAVPAKAYPTH